jgi:hypothetical protein
MAEVKATDKDSPKIVTGKNPDNKQAAYYTGTEFFPGDTKDPIGKYTQPKEYSDVDLSNNGYPQTGIKTDGIEKRGVGAATKGTKARGPMA